MTKFGLINPARTKSGRTVFGEFSDSGNQFVTNAPGGGSSINA
jgi:hypothetical protein